jgi:GNAT superfamily N-acetyltransferase
VVSLSKANLVNCQELYDMQIKSFAALLAKYQDFDYSPGAEKIEKTENRLKDMNSDYYFICLGDIHIGAIRIFKHDDQYKLKQIYILPQYQDKGYAQRAIKAVESLYPDAKRWALDTIKQETKLCHLYEKMGYKPTGQEQTIKESMTLVFYAKQMQSGGKASPTTAAEEASINGNT